MSVRSGLMALLAEGGKYGAQLRSEFEERTGGTWPLNVGQVYTTLDRLVRDGLAEQADAPDAEGRIAYRLTDAGRSELRTWWTTPVDRTSTPRDELTIRPLPDESAPAATTVAASPPCSPTPGTRNGIDGAMARISASCPG